MSVLPFGHRREFRWHPGGTQAALRRHSGDTRAALRRHWGGTRAALRRHWGGTRAALGRHNCQDHNCRLNFQFISIHFVQNDDTWHPLHCSVTYNGLIGCLVASILGFRFHYEFRPQCRPSVASVPPECRLGAIGNLVYDPQNYSIFLGENMLL